MTFWPKQLNFQNILIHSLGSLIAGIIGSVIILVITFFLSNVISIPGTFEQARTGIQTSALFPILLSIITLIGTTITIILTYIIWYLTDAERYKKNIIILWQIAFFAFLTYVFVTPVYIYAGIQDYDNIMIVFLFHTIIVTFGTSIILEILNNYRYILTGIYGSFSGLFISIIITFLIFNSFSSGFAKLISLILLLPIINFSTTFFKQIFEFLYFHYHKYTNQDQLWDIFYQIELEEKELLREEEEKNTL